METQLRAMIRSARRIVAFTGAGISAESGLDTYRSDDTGLWDKVDPMVMASIDAWPRNHQRMWPWYLWRAGLARAAKPNAGHRALASWGAHIITQNIDDLHERAGSEDVIHLHGSLFSWRCTDCSQPATGVEPLVEPVDILMPPHCPDCGGLIRPGVVLFGEQLPEREWNEAAQRIAAADLVIIVGTSGVVQPAASLPLIAAHNGTPIIEVSPHPTELSPIATVSWREPASRLENLDPGP